ncbi:MULTISPECIES: AMP-binding protein [unclassified Streptomyces]|uniref:AMP-binding protein n=1 Tax=unclassified Streptomyces TaxID=2593676 RepID=UPI00094036AD|nr:AMP-binding protein [Streptomyces sp. TSRI0107]
MNARSSQAANGAAPAAEEFSLRRAWDEACTDVAIAHLRSGTRVTFGDLERRTASAAEELLARVEELGLERAVVVHEVHDEVGTLAGVLAAARAGVGLCLVRAGTWAESSRRLCSQLVAAGFDGVLHEGALATRGTRAPGERAAGHRVLLHSGGTTGRPKLIGMDVSPSALAGMLRLYRQAGWRPGLRQLVVLPLYHAAGLLPALIGLLDGHRLTVTGRRFDPDELLDVIGAESVEWFCATPTHLRLMAWSERFDTAGLDSLQGLVHTAAACDHETKRRWIDRVGGERVHEFYSSTEQVGLTFCTGLEWTQRPGTVGRGYLTRISVRDADGRPVPPGTVGEVYMRSLSHARNTAPGVRRAPDGYASVGDRGHLDADGYLFLVGRDGDMFTVGGENVYPLELERVILEVPGVRDAMVRPRPHRAFGSIAEALVVADEPTSETASAIKAHCRQSLPPASRPHVLTFVPELPRTETGKLKRLSTDD